MRVQGIPVIKSFSVSYFDIKAFLLDSGYKYRAYKKDWIREISGGRFHAKPLSAKKVNIHYDLYGEKGDHITNIPMPYTIKSEQSRIGKLLSQALRNAKERSKISNAV